MKRLKAIFDALNPQERILFWSAFAVLVASAALLGTLLFRAYTRVVPAHGGELVEGAAGQPIYVNPVLASGDIDKSLVRLVFAPLSDLAEKIQPSDDGSSWDIRLKQNLRWSDGKKLTSDDVVFTVTRLQDHESPYANAWQGVVAERQSELEVRFTAPANSPSFADRLQSFYVIPKHLFAETPTAHWRLSDYVLKPVGSGPYMFAAFDQQPEGVEKKGFIERYRLVRNPNYAGAAPYISEITFAFYPNRDDLVRAFNAGQIDSMGDLDPTLLQEIKRPHTTETYDMPTYYGVFFNQTQNLALQDPAVRQALNLAVDRNALVNDVLQGQGAALTSPVPGYAAGEFNPDAANQLLDKAGWTMNGNVRQKTVSKNSTTTLSFTLTVPDIEFLKKTANDLKTMWQKIGVDLTIDTSSPDDLASHTINNRDYQAILFGNILSPGYDLYPFWDSSQRFYPGLNLSLYSNRNADVIIESARTMSDANARNQKLASLGSIIDGDHPAVILFSPKYVYVTSKSVRGITPGTLAEPSDRFATVASWYVETTRTFN